jgi:LysM repeat protein
MTECNPYGKKLHHIKEVTYELDRQKLIIVKTLPLPQKHSFMRVISVADMIENHVKVERSVRFKGTDSTFKQASLNKKNADAKVNLVNFLETNDIKYSYYKVVKGDALSKIAKKLDLSVKELVNLNALNVKSTLRIGQKIKVPFEKKVVDAMLRAKYTVEERDTLLSISKMFKLSAKDIVKFNHIKDATIVRKGKVLKLPLPYVLDRLYDKEQREDDKGIGSTLDINAFGTHKLRVTATAYTSHGNQTDDTPFLAAWNNKLRPGMKIIAVSRDLLTRFGMRNGTKVRIGGLRGFYRVRDKMNKRYKKRIDIYMGLNLRKALKWGRRSVVIYW